MTLHLHITLEDQPDPFCMTTAEAERARAEGERLRTQARARTADALIRAGEPEAAAALLAPDAPPMPAPRRVAEMRPKLACQLTRLHDQGRLRAEQVRAGQEIAQVYFDITASLHARTTANYGERIPGGGHGHDWPAVIRSDVRERYAAWRDWAGAITVRHRLSLAGLTIEVVAENLGPRQAANRLSMDHRTVLPRLQQSLWRYVVIAGWVPEGPAARAEKAA